MRLEDVTFVQRTAAGGRVETHGLLKALWCEGCSQMRLAAEMRYIARLAGYRCLTCLPPAPPRGARRPPAPKPRPTSESATPPVSTVSDQEPLPALAWTPAQSRVLRDLMADRRKLRLAIERAEAERHAALDQAAARLVDLQARHDRLWGYSERQWRLIKRLRARLHQDRPSLVELVSATLVTVGERLRAWGAGTGVAERWGLPALVALFLLALAIVRW